MACTGAQIPAVPALPSLAVLDFSGSIYDTLPSISRLTALTELRLARGPLHHCNEVSRLACEAACEWVAKP